MKRTKGGMIVEDYGRRYYRAFLDGDSLGFERIVEVYRENLILFIQQYVRDFSAAEDVAQDVFVKLYVKKPHFLPSASFKTWLYTIAKREAINYLKKHKHQDGTEQSILKNQEDDRNYLEIILEDEKKRVLHKILNELKSEYRQVLYLRYFEEMSVEDISVLLKKRPSQISDRLYHAKKALRMIILEGGVKYEILRTGIE